MIVAKKLNNVPWSKAWSAAVREPAQEFDRTQLELLEGSIPTDLQGRLFQNGPGRLERGGQRAGHWFDGDGAILGVTFEAGSAYANYRYVKTAGYQAEEKAGRYLFKSYGLLAPGSWFKRLRAPFKNAANTSVLPLPDRLLALWEGGLPHALDLQSLETLGLDNLEESLKSNQSYSAHPKVDPTTGEIFNFAIQPGPQTQLWLYRSDASGRIQHQMPLALKGVPLVHDMLLADPYVVICIPPVRMGLFPALMNLKSFGESLVWKPELGTEILIFDRQTLSLISRNTVDPWFYWHYANGYANKAGSLVMDLVRYKDFSVHGQLRSVAAGYVDGIMGGQLWRMTLDPQTATVLDQVPLYTGACEFPIVPSRQVGQCADAIYYVSHRETQGTKWVTSLGEDPRQMLGEFVQTLGQLNPETGKVAILDCGYQRYPFSPIYAERPLTDSGAERGWIMSLVYDGQLQQTELWILDSESWESPRCRLKLPTIIPFGFHGCWVNLGESCP